MSVSSSVRMPTFIAGNAITALYSAMRKAFDSCEQVVGDFDPLPGCALGGGKALRSGKPHALVGEHRPDDGLDALEVALAPGERARIDREKRLPDARLVALLGEEGIGFGADCRSGQRGADELEREREHRAFRAADRKQAAALDRLFRIGRRLAVAVERPAFRDLLAL